MSTRESYPAGVPCWVESLQPDPERALQFYGALFGWDFAGPGAMPGGGSYFVARLGGLDVAGIGSMPAALAGTPATWSQHVRVDDVDASARNIIANGGSVAAGPLDVAPAGRMAVVSDPSGAPFCVWEARDREGAQRVNEPGAWAMSMLFAPDPRRAEDFYAAVFGWQVEPFGDGSGGVTLFRRPGYVGGEPQQPVPRDVVAVMVPAAGPDAPPPHWSLDFWVRDADAEAKRAVQLGGAVVIAPRRTSNFITAVLADPQGATFSISELLTRR